jgi:hypothetical protein
VVNIPRNPIAFETNATFSYSVHELSKSLYALVISTHKAKGPIELSSLNFFGSKPTENMVKKIASANSKPVLVSELIPQISNNTRRELLSCHVLIYYFEEFQENEKNRLNKYEPRTLYDDVVAETAEIYKVLTNWGEPAAAMLLAKFENISVRTIQNRLRLAREKGLLAQPGSGKRFN